MTKFELKINSRLEIKTNESVFNSTIQNINEDSFFISIPMEKGYYVKFENGERLTCIVIGKIQVYINLKVRY